MHRNTSGPVVTAQIVTAQILVVPFAELLIIKFRPFWGTFPNSYGLLEKIIVAKRPKPLS